MSGEAGIGKSRLVEVLRERAEREGCTRITFRCSPYYQQSALYPVIEHLQRRLQFHRDDTPETKLTKLEQVLQAYRFTRTRWCRCWRRCSRSRYPRHAMRRCP